MVETKPEVRVRWMVDEDIPEVMDIEREAFRYPWTIKDFKECRKDKSITVHIAEAEDHIAGYMAYGDNGDYYELLTIAVDKRFRRCGVGTLLINKLKAKLSVADHQEILTDVREGNPVAQGFLHNLCFRSVDIKRNAFEDSKEDAITFRYVVPGGRAYRPPEEYTEKGE